MSIMLGFWPEVRSDFWGAYLHVEKWGSLPTEYCIRDIFRHVRPALIFTLCLLHLVTVACTLQFSLLRM